MERTAKICIDRPFEATSDIFTVIERLAHDTKRFLGYLDFSNISGSIDIHLYVEYDRLSRYHLNKFVHRLSANDIPLRYADYEDGLYFYAASIIDEAENELMRDVDIGEDIIRKEVVGAELVLRHRGKKNDE